MQTRRGEPDTIDILGFGMLLGRLDYLDTGRAESLDPAGSGRPRITNSRPPGLTQSNMRGGISATAALTQTASYWRPAFQPMASDLEENLDL